MITKVSSEKKSDVKKNIRFKNFGISYAKVRQANFDIWDHFYYKSKFRNFRLLPIRFKHIRVERKSFFENRQFLKRFIRLLKKRRRFAPAERKMKLKVSVGAYRKKFINFLNGHNNKTRLLTSSKKSLRRWRRSRFRKFLFSRFIRGIRFNNNLFHDKTMTQYSHLRVKFGVYKLFRRLQPFFFKRGHSSSLSSFLSNVGSHHLGSSTILKSLFVNIGQPTIKFSLKRVGRRDRRFLQMIPWRVRTDRRRGRRLRQKEFLRRRQLKDFNILVGRPPRPRRKRNYIATVKFYRKIFCFFMGNLRERRLRFLFNKIRRYNYRRSFISMLERRLDFILLRSLFVRNLFTARQSIRRGEFLINGRVVIRANSVIRPYDVISIKPEFFEKHRLNLLRRLHFDMLKCRLPSYLEVNFRMLNICFIPFLYKRRSLVERGKVFSKKMPYRHL